MKKKKLEVKLTKTKKKLAKTKTQLDKALKVIKAGETPKTKPAASKATADKAPAKTKSTPKPRAPRKPSVKK